MKTILKIGIAVLLLVPPAFVWGFFVHRDSIFPYTLLRSIGLGRRADGAVPVKVRRAENDPLASLPYLDSAFDPDHELRGVLLHNREKAYPGLNFYGSRTRSSAELVDMDGAVIHEWSYPSAAWQHIQLLPDGGLIAIVKDRRMLRLDRNSDLLWSLNGRFHHDFQVLPDGEIVALARRAAVIPEVHPDLPTREDTLMWLSPQGEVLKEISLLDVFRGTPFEFLVPSVGHLDYDRRDIDNQDLELDILHTNHVEVFDGRLADRSPLYRKGNLLLSCRNINTILIADGDTHKAIWAWGPSTLTYQHHPTLLDNGNILVFNNGMEESQVLELDPLTRQVVWCYGPGREFFSKLRGSNQRLPNGNTLITESDKGYVIEVTREGEVVWSFANPDVDDEGKRGAIWRMTRIRPEDYPFLDEIR